VAPCHLRVEEDFLLARQVGLHVTLEAPQQERLQDAVQLLHHLDALLALREGAYTRPLFGSTEALLMA